MPDVIIPTDFLDLIQSKACETWIVEHCPGDVIGRRDGDAYVLSFSDDQEADAFRRRWLA